MSRRAWPRPRPANPGGAGPWWGHSELDEPSSAGIEAGEVHEAEVPGNLRFLVDALVVIEQVAAPIEDEPIPVALEGLRVV
jgi:hypothetical protein